MTTFNQIDPERSGSGRAGRLLRAPLLGAAIAVALVAGIAAPVVALGDAGTDSAQYSARLHDAFRVALAMPADGAVLERVTAVARKSDRLAAPVGCGAQTWPDIHPPCLVSADGIARAPARTVTVEYRIGERSSVLVRLPASRLAVNSND